MTTIDMIAAALVLVRGLFFAINNMSRATDLHVRITWLLLTVGAAAVLLLSRTPHWPDVIFHCGIAALVYCDRRHMGNRSIFIPGKVFEPKFPQSKE